MKFFQVLPRWIATILGKHGVTRCAVSKYTTSIDAQGVAAVRGNRFNDLFHSIPGAA